MAFLCDDLAKKSGSTSTFQHGILRLDQAFYDAAKSRMSFPVDYINE